ncbi:UDP-N-acetylmuramate--L-alanine ligase [Rufibacter glacialis]|uniref:UDP-N-acetylmuramate--L-alanine ligase n=1 Tax=Rufibacter glacialis TaxID=1259555 RepID=A0A5M8Q8P0_9BACT|nr:UDP-N-acetylmuramate--L-alanine ligase [Rufibacter glacialis]KAA6432297.1 UDP-N-acetylmuramate--L-alanine ligase [Rufibacter glacialis]GGK77516.1 UDP-N-acetylmuramate--L-alanine ligase [Rufibacter glacialis]
MNLQQYRHIYFLGIGGIGMSALARWFLAKGFAVAGYDKTPTPLTQKLEKEGATIHFTDDVQLIPASFRENKEETLVILTPAVPASHQEKQYLVHHGFTIMKRSQVLGLLTQDQYLVAVAGTHGKTTTSSMVAHLLHHAGVSTSAFLGGISTDLGSNLLLPHQEEERALAVVEADEYDRSFLTLHPDIAIVTSTDPDHLDIYGEKEALVESFKQFVRQIKPNGYLLLNHTADQSLAEVVDPSVTVIRYGLEKEELAVTDLQIADGAMNFSVKGRNLVLPQTALQVPGFHNVENAVAAAQAVSLLGVPVQKIQSGISTYTGVKRRFEKLYATKKRVYLDDYAHHPREIEAFLQSVRALYPGQKLRVIFQPHLFTRTRDFLEGFARSLSLADEVWLLEIYPAREEPIPGVTSALLYDQITGVKKRLLPKNAVLQALREDLDYKVLATIGAGDIDTLVPEIKCLLEEKDHVME